MATHSTALGPDTTSLSWAGIIAQLVRIKITGHLPVESKGIGLSYEAYIVRKEEKQIT